MIYIAKINYKTWLGNVDLKEILASRKLSSIVEGALN